MPAKLTPLRAVPCTNADCAKSFATKDEMIAHKLDEPGHNYCKKCGYDAKDWDDLTQHKVDAMAPFLEGRMKHDRDEKPKHIVCEFCGEDFKSFGGRKQHRKQRHQADQCIKCPACPRIFVRASLMIEHLEQDLCKGTPKPCTKHPYFGDCPCEKEYFIRPVTRRDFHVHIQQKCILNDILKAPSMVMQRLQSNKAFKHNADKPGLITDGTEQEDNEEGGITIIDQQDESQNGGYRPLEPERENLIDLQISIPSIPRENFPRLPGAGTSGVAESLRRLSITSGSRTPSISASDYASEITSFTSRRGGIKVRTEYQTGTTGPPSTIEFDTDYTASEATTETISVAAYNRPPVWTSKNTSKALFPAAKSTPRTADWQSRVREKNAAEAEEDKSNLFVNRFWQTSSDGYNPDIFFNELISKYCCPMGEQDQDCGVVCDTPFDMERHMVQAHGADLRRMRCPGCLKLYKSVTALVAHCESQSECEVQKRSDYKKFLDDITGGFLKVEQVEEPKIFRKENALVKASGLQPMNGVTDSVYLGRNQNHG